MLWPHLDHLAPGRSRFRKWETVGSHVADFVCHQDEGRHPARRHTRTDLRGCARRMPPRPPGRRKATRCFASGMPRCWVASRSSSTRSRRLSSPPTATAPTPSFPLRSLPLGARGVNATINDARSSPRTLLRRNPRPHAAARGGGSEEARHRCAGRARLPLRGREGLRDAAPAGAARRRPAREGAGRARGAQGPARRRAGGGDPGLPEERRPDLPRCRRRSRAIRRRASSTSRSSRSPAADAGRAGRDPARHRQEPSPGRNRCAGARPPPSRAPCAGCARCNPSSAPSAPRPRSPRSCPSRSTASRSGDVTHGHRFLAPGAIRVRRFDDYAPALERAKVVLDTDRRKDIILHDAQDLAFAQGLELVEDEGLLEEVAGLVEWPVVLMGSFDEAFLDIPPEVIRTTIRANQKCFVLRDPERPASLANRFILTSNLVGQRRRHDDRRRQRARGARAALGRQVLLGDGPEGAARRPAGEAEEHRLPREARHAIRARRAHRGAGQGARARRRRRSGARPSAPRVSPRPISSPRWSASSPSCRA